MVVMIHEGRSVGRRHQEKQEIAFAGTSVREPSMRTRTRTRRTTNVAFKRGNFVFTQLIALNAINVALLPGHKL